MYCTGGIRCEKASAYIQFVNKFHPSRKSRICKVVFTSIWTNLEEPAPVCGKARILCLMDAFLPPRITTMTTKNHHPHLPHPSWENVPIVLHPTIPFIRIVCVPFVENPPWYASTTVKTSWSNIIVAIMKPCAIATLPISLDSIRPNWKINDKHYKH